MVCCELGLGWRLSVVCGGLVWVAKSRRARRSSERERAAPRAREGRGGEGGGGGGGGGGGEDKDGDERCVRRWRSWLQEAVARAQA